MTTAMPELKADSYWSRLALHKVPQKYLVLSAFVSYIILGLSYIQNVPVWLAFGLALIPWAFMVFIELEWSYKHFGWFALFAAMAFVQVIHYSEHCIQVIQVHIFGDPLAQSQAIFGELNAEWVHFTGDTLLTIGTLVLLWKFPRNVFLWISVPFAILHEAEHTFLIFNYLFEGVRAGAPGLLASPGGAIGGGIGLNRPDLHWIYNTLYTIPFVLALVHQLKRTYDESLDEAFANAPKEALIEASHHMATFTYGQAETIIAPGDEANRLYVIVEGEAGVYVHEDGVEREIATLHHGQYFGEIALLLPGSPHTKTVRANTPLTVLAMDEATFRHLMEASGGDQSQLLATARERVSLPEPKRSRKPAARKRQPAPAGVAPVPAQRSGASTQRSGASAQRSASAQRNGASPQRTTAARKRQPAAKK